MPNILMLGIFLLNLETQRKTLFKRHANAIFSTINPFKYPPSYTIGYSN